MRFCGPHYNEWDELYGLIKDIFCGLAVTCFLYALHRTANGVELGARLKALDRYGDAYTPEEREELIHKIKRDSMKF
ncbi:MAG: hypothetical protein Q8K99_04275 [Actinomycetota bacterium]|nr:hypothetical protein [Actinomycetota bacterium]